MTSAQIAPGLSSGSAAAPGPGEFSTTGTDSGGSSRGVHPSPSAGARIASPGGGATSVAGRASGAVPAAAALGPQGAPAGDSSSTERRSA